MPFASNLRRFFNSTSIFSGEEKHWPMYLAWLNVQLGRTIPPSRCVQKKLVGAPVKDLVGKGPSHFIVKICKGYLQLMFVIVYCDPISMTDILFCDVLCQKPWLIV